MHIYIVVFWLFGTFFLFSVVLVLLLLIFFAVLERNFWCRLVQCYQIQRSTFACIIVRVIEWRCLYCSPLIMARAARMGCTPPTSAARALPVPLGTVPILTRFITVATSSRLINPFTHSFNKPSPLTVNTPSTLSSDACQKCQNLD